MCAKPYRGTVRQALKHLEDAGMISRRRGAGTTVESPEPGEVIFRDDAGHVAARRWCWRQSAESASGEGASRVLVTVEGHHDDARRDVDAAVGDLEALLHEHAGATRIERDVLDAERRVFAVE